MSRLLLLSLLTYALLLAGLATLSGGVLALALPLVIYLGAALLYGPEELQLKITRTLSADRVTQGTPVVVRLLVTNEGSGVEELLVEDIVPEGLKLADGEPRLLASLPPDGTVELEYTICGNRGRHVFPSVRVTANDHLGLFRRQSRLAALGRLIVLPEVLRLRRVAIRPLRTRAFAGPIPSRQPGSGVEFFGVREYELGDPLRWINWRLSARHPHALFTNEFEQERIADVGLILDARQRNDVRLRGESLFEHGVRAMASLADVFLSDGNRVGLLIYGRFLAWTFPGYGKTQRERILRALAQAETGDSMVFDTFDHLPTRYFPVRSQLVLISPLCNDDLPFLIRLRARGYQLLVISPDPVAFEARILGASEAKGSPPAVELAVRIASLERALLLRQLRQAGIQIVDWQVDRPFDQTIHASLGRVPHWFRAVGMEA